MSVPYNHKVIEQKWQKIWDDKKRLLQPRITANRNITRWWSSLIRPDRGCMWDTQDPTQRWISWQRKRRMQGYNVLYPMGWDAFGLPTENYAIKNKIHPKIVTANNVARFKEQLKSLGYSFDWDREVNTTDEDYYK